jgi:ribosomal protein S18 acetylase RimI-like enzyme
VSGYEIPEVPEIQNGLRAALAALVQIPGVRADPRSIDDMPVSDLITDLRYVVESAEVAAAAQLGALVSWKSPHETTWELVVAGIDFGHDGDGFDVTLGEDATEGPYGDWTGSALYNAALAYKRECGWDFAPGAGGVWLVMLAPVSGIGGSGEGPWLYTGHVTGFVILYDRDEDGSYESVGHIWTASAWRRRGIARRLLEEAHRRFGSSLVFERPYTDAGASLITAFPGNGKNAD